MATIFWCAIGLVLLRFVYVCWTAFARVDNPAGIPYRIVIRSAWPQILFQGISIAIRLDCRRKILPTIINIVVSRQMSPSLSNLLIGINQNPASEQLTRSLNHRFAQAERSICTKLIRSSSPKVINILYAQHEVQIASSATSNGRRDGRLLMEVRDISTKNLLLIRHFGFSAYREMLKKHRAETNSISQWDGTERRMASSRRSRSVPTAAERRANPFGRRKYDKLELSSVLRVMTLNEVDSSMFQPRSV
jgi:hypothetical protein